MSVSTYWYKADGLITQIADPATLLGLSYVNQGEVRAKGLELEAQMRLRGDIAGPGELCASERHGSGDADVAAELTAPHGERTNQLPGPTRQSIVSVEALYLSRRGTLAGATVSMAAPASVTMIQPLGVSWELFGSLHNIFDQQYSDPASSALVQDSIVQNGRTARIGLRWSLGPK